MEFEIKNLSHSTWKDFVELMLTDSQCRDCWCLNHREPASCPTGAEAQRKMNEYVHENSAHGVLAYKGQQPVGWIAVDPMTSLLGHDCQSTGKANEWSIHCLYVKDEFRGKGVSVKLIQAAVKYAQAKGAKIISAFPIPSENREQFPANEAEFSGRFSTFMKLGFKSTGEGSKFYQRVELFL